jgi:bla regulator protein BlaR1
MQPFAEAAGWLFGWLLRNSAHAALLGVVVWILERTFCRDLHPRWRYGLWLVVVVRLLLPIGPESRLSLFNLVDLAPARVAGAALQVLRLPTPVVVPAVEPPDPLADTPWWFIGALALWFSGALTLAGLVWRDHRRLRQSLAETSPIMDAEILDLLRQGKAVMSVRRRVAIVEAPQITSPAITGWRRPRVLLPSGLLERLTPDEIRFLFLHELAHVKRADLPFNWVIAIIQILHWFNPVVWLALRRLLTVREEVCDDLVLRRCFPGAARDYGMTLLRLIEECAPRRLVPSLAGILGDLPSLRHRIRCIRNFRIRDPHPCLPASLTVAVAIVGLTERIGEPMFWRSNTSGHSGEAGDTPAMPRRPGGRQPTQLAGLHAEDLRRTDTASLVVGTLTAALQQVIHESRGSAATGTETPDENPAPVVSRSTPTPAVASAIPIARAQLEVIRNKPRPYPLPPIRERGTILNPPNSAPAVQQGASVAGSPGTEPARLKPAAGASSLLHQRRG